MENRQLWKNAYKVLVLRVSMTKTICTLFKVKGIFLLCSYLSKTIKDKRIYFQQVIKDTKLQKDNNAYTWHVASWSGPATLY